MRTYIVIMVCFLLGAGVTTFLVWAAIQAELDTNAAATQTDKIVAPVGAEVGTTSESSLGSSSSSVPVEPADTAAAPLSLTEAPPEPGAVAGTDGQLDGTPLADLPLTESQQGMLQTFGIEVETFVITPTMISCSEAKIGKERVEAIMTGDSPNLPEALEIFGCISS